MKKIIYLFLCLPSLAFSKPAYLVLLSQAVPDGNLKHKCLTCHGGAGLNAFGKDFAKIKHEMGSKFDITFWDKLRFIDSDKDSVTNEDEILNGKNPGELKK